ncbi:GNAT family N-acetyltransferase [Paenibacillus crassostreae]|uniref:GNAT family acetyltransferase n=1 Tax=Paenibacillus crassostreae TaxID=1763538 RepID=A0A167DU82_9BACL|nr:GNAT family N-acetyltransferase [Paenibacillus crassostreae]AOZ91055.1 GNAT family N-acetyltransferase [Paenibacillus crassostreae]OAB74782.1 GNAT family acetyltransferase [Paenibacillus crassostreae]
MDMRLERVPKENKVIIDHMMQFYLYDFTEFLDIDLEATGKFTAYPDLDTFWELATGKYVFLISADGKPGGFAMVERPFDPVEGEYYMTEFFIMKKYRRSGLGSWAAKELFQTFKGTWKVTQMRNNTPAQKFWQKVIGNYTGGRYTQKSRPNNGNLSQYFKS